MSAVRIWPGGEDVRHAADAARRDAAGSDATGRVAPQTVEALTAAGFPRCFVPERWGGAGATFDAVTKAVATVGEGCASAAWIASLWAYNGRFCGYLPDEGQKEVWADGADTRLVSSMVAAGVEVKPVAGGWDLSGSWLYVSGVEFADWALVSSALPRPGDRSIRVFAVPRDSFSFKDTWSSVGMRATGSHTLVVDKAFIPEYRTFVWDDMCQGNAPASAARPASAPLFAVNGLTFAAPALGASRGALRLVERYLADRPGAARAAARDMSEVAFARAAGEIDAAGLLLARIAAAADQGRRDEGLTERSHRDATLAVEILVGAVDRLLPVTGTRGLAATHGLQRIWRDVHAASSHAALQFGPAALGYTRAVLAGRLPEREE